jgi:hypothetical protein
VAASASQCGPAVTGGALAEGDGEKTASEVGENGSASEGGSASGRRRRRDSEGDRRVRLMWWAIGTRWITGGALDSLGSSSAS